MNRSLAPARRRVLLIGLDSADAELIERWAGEGALPGFRRLMDEGRWSRLGTTADVMHVSAWPTLYTGTTPGHHGMYHAYQVRAGVHGVQRTEPQWCGVPPFWKALDDAGRRCVIFDAFMDYPLPGFRGTQILEYGTWTWFGEPGSIPRSMLGDLKRRFGPYPAPEHANLVQVPDEPLRFRDQLVEGARVKARITRALMSEQDWDFMFVTFGEPHGAGHYLWHFGDVDYPLQPLSESLRGINLVRDVYAAVDSAIASILGEVDDNTTVIVTSADGMGPNYSGCHLMPELLHRMDLFHGGGVGGGDGGDAKPRNGVLQTLRQAVPLGFRQGVTRCLPKRLRYQLGMKWVNSSIDWQRAKVFCIPNSNEGYFRVNLAGREPTGIVAGGTEYDDILGRLGEELAGLRAPRSGLPAAERISMIDDIFPGQRRQDLPDASISWNLEARIVDEIVSAGHGSIRRQAGHATSPYYTGNHRAAAFAVSYGINSPDARAATHPHLLDIAPTVLQLLGVDLPGYYEGQAWSTT
jgi:predicted AlkP superfamily phosphohydrolase/phosphomutase